MDWKSIGVLCGKALNESTVKALEALDFADFSRLSAKAIRDRIQHTLPVDGPYYSNSRQEPYSDRRSLAWDLAVVIKHGGPIYPSWIVCFGINPFKLECRLPDKAKLSAEKVKEYCLQLFDVSYPGTFVRVKFQFSTGHIVYMYSFTATEGCGEIGEQHADLPLPKPSSHPFSEEEFSKIEQSLGAGNAYIHMNVAATSGKFTSSGDIQMEFNSKISKVDGNEETRTDFLIDHLKSKLPSLYQNVEVVKVEKKRKGKETFCNFTGGGDLKISSTKDCLVMTMLDVECKYSTTKSDGDVRLQLQANLYNLMVREYVNKLESASSLEELTKILKLRKLSMYGMSFGTIHGVEVLKMSLNFETPPKLSYEIKFKDHTYLPKEVMIDCCITAMIDCICKRSPSPN